MAISPEKPLRKDAERNRQRIIAAAREVFAQRGLGVSLDDIADHAGVGVGTVYRRFPDREQLIDALFEDRLGEMVAAGNESLEIEDPWLALETYLRRVLSMQVEDRGLKELLLSTSGGNERLERARAQIQPLVTALVTRAQAAGVLRADVAPSDVLLVQVAVCEVADYTRDTAPEVWQRMLSIALDGLRADRVHASSVPCEPLNDEQVVCAMTNWGGRRRR